MLGGLGLWDRNTLDTYPAQRQLIFDEIKLNPTAEKIELVKSHIILLRDASYAAFVTNHYSNRTANTLWWKDEVWLDNNFYLNVNLSYNQLSQDEKLFIKSNPIKAYEISIITATSNTEYSRWALLYLSSNLTVSIEDFRNQFLSTPEGLDGSINSFDLDFWNNSNLVVPPQILPSYQNFYSAFPKAKTADEVYQLIGGSILTSHNTDPANYSNACALRVSRALNYSGIIIPVYFNTTTGKQVTQKGGDGKNYFLNAKDLNIWLRKTFGTPTHHFTKAQGGLNGRNFPGLLKEKKGIFSMISDNPNWASGHADLFDGKICDAGCHFDGPIAYIDIWILQ